MKGVYTNGEKRKNIKGSCKKGVQDTLRSQIHAQPKKRCRECSDPSSQQEKEIAGSKLVLIKWLDSFGCSSNWQPLGQIEDIKPMICLSVGWIDYQNDCCVVVVPHRSEDHNGIPQQGCGDMTIPRQAILNITPLSLALAS